MDGHAGGQFEWARVRIRNQPEMQIVFIGGQAVGQMRYDALCTSTAKVRDEQQDSGAFGDGHGSSIGSKPSIG